MITDSARAVSRAWNKFFFEPTSPATIGVFRIAYGIVVFINLLGKFPCRGIFYGDQAIVSPAAMIPYLHGPDWLNLRFIPQTEPGLGLYFAFLMIASVLLTLGFFTRLSAAIVYLGLVSLANRDAFCDNAGDILMRCDGLLLIFSSAGAAYSIDKWIAVRKGRESAQLVPTSAWAQRVIQVQLSYLYISTAYMKLAGDSWRDGTAMYYAIRYLELKRFSFKYLFYYLWQIKIASYSVMVAEFSAGTLIWVKKLRYLVLLAAFGLHEGINLAMQFPIFQYIMIATLLTFVFPEDMEWLVDQLVRLLPAARGRPAGEPAGLRDRG